MSGLLPKGFEALEPHVAWWAAETMAERDTRRLDSSEDQRLAFYNAASPILAQVFAHLDGKAMTAFDEADWRLHRLMLSLVHVTIAVEVQRDGEALHARGARRMPIVHCHSDPV